MSSKVKNILFAVCYSIIIFILGFILFHNLGNNAIADWDEARHGINAYEMLKSHNWIVSTYQFEPDLWNLKPPLSYYLIALSYNIFGYSAFSLRIYSVISMFIILFIAAFTLYRYSGRIAALVFGLMYISFGEFFFGHCGRTGDADALFMLLYLVSIISLFLAYERHWFLYIFGLSFSLAFLCKSFHAAPILLIGCCFVFFSKLFKKLKVKNYIIMLLTISLPIIIWVSFRFLADGMDFVGSMFGIDVIDRIDSGVSSGGSYFGFLKSLLTTRSTQVLIVVIIICYIIKIFLNRTLRISVNRLELMLLIWFCVSLIFFSLTRTPQYWYYYPTFLCLILLAAIAVNNTVLLIINKRKEKIIFLRMSVLFLQV